MFNVLHRKTHKVRARERAVKVKVTSSAHIQHLNMFYLIFSLHYTWPYVCRSELNWFEFEFEFKFTWPHPTKIHTWPSDRCEHLIHFFSSKWMGYMCVCLSISLCVYIWLNQLNRLSNSCFQNGNHDLHISIVHACVRACVIVLFSSFCLICI